LWAATSTRASPGTWQTRRRSYSGKWDFKDEEFTELAAKVLGEERAFWNDYSAPHYLISLLPAKKHPGSYAGTALENSFTNVSMSQKAPPSWTLT